MGLDMYLNAERFLWSYPEDGPDAQVAKTVKEMMPELAGVDTAKVQTITAEVGYWRKANQIHNWFVKNVQDGVDECEPHDVSREQLIALRDTCQKVLDDNTLADTLLPTGAGFFFGGTDYDEWYFKDVERTVQVCNDVLEQFFTQKLDDGTVYSQWEIKYCSSW
jgi:hypothetical protein